jgi:endonuclease YncB( thermonuclease family)
MRFLLIIFSFLALQASAQTVDVCAEVRAVHDGDSYRVVFQDTAGIFHNEWVRLWAVDCPEVVSNHISKNQPGGVQAGNQMRDLLKGEFVWLDTLYRDGYDRLVCKVYSQFPLGSTDSTTLFILTSLTDYVIENGLGWADTKYEDVSPEEEARLKKLQRDAQDARVGLWGLPGRKLRPSTWRERNRR